jgi:MinD-like ATPase involved in chromosome partitioning or flagellar assembly/CheY-like chemotaxis protein
MVNLDKVNQTVLVIDPDAVTRKYLDTALRTSGYNVLLATSALEGLNMAWLNLPNVIVVDPVLPDLPVVEMISRLRQDRRTAKVPCIALCSRDLQDQIPLLTSAGFDEYLVKSKQAVPQLLELIPRLLKEQSKKGKLLVVFLSAKGGTGTSSLCANIAMCVGKERPDARLALVDLVLPIGSIANIVGYEEQLNLATVTALTDEGMVSFPSENFPKLPEWHFHLLAGSPDPESSSQLQVGRVNAVVTILQNVYDFVFIDLGRSLSCISLPIIQRADVIVCILGTDLSTIKLTQIMWEYLKTKGVDSKWTYTILNRAIGLEGLTKAEAEQILGVEIRATIPYMEGNFTLANNRHEPIATKFPNDTSTIMLEQSARQIAELGLRSLNR